MTSKNHFPDGFITTKNAKIAVPIIGLVILSGYVGYKIDQKYNPVDVETEIDIADLKKIFGNPNDMVKKINAKIHEKMKGVVLPEECKETFNDGPLRLNQMCGVIIFLTKNNRENNKVEEIAKFFVNLYAKKNNCPSESLNAILKGNLLIEEVQELATELSCEYNLIKNQIDIFDIENLKKNMGHGNVAIFHKLGSGGGHFLTLTRFNNKFYFLENGFSAGKITIIPWLNEKATWGQRFLRWQLSVPKIENNKILLIKNLI